MLVSVTIPSFRIAKKKSPTQVLTSDYIFSEEKPISPKTIVADIEAGSGILPN